MVGCWPGVYVITNTCTGQAYVGIASELADRWGCHRGQLNKGKHYNRQLQADWNAFGSDAFEWKVLEYMERRCTGNDMRRAEHRWIERYKSKGTALYNIARVARIIYMKDGKFTVEEHEPPSVEPAALMGPPDTP